MSDSCRTLLIHNIILQFDIHCQTVSNSYRTMLIQQYYYVNDIQCQTVSNSVRQLQNYVDTTILLCK